MNTKKKKILPKEMEREVRQVLDITAFELAYTGLTGTY